MDRFVHEIYVLQQLHIDGCDFSCVMTAQNMIHFIQRRKVIVPCVITIADSQPFVRVHVEEGEFAVRKFVCARDRGVEQPAPEQQKPDNRRLQERSTSPRPGIWKQQDPLREKVHCSLSGGADPCIKSARVSQPIFIACHVLVIPRDHFIPCYSIFTA